MVKQISKYIEKISKPANIIFSLSTILATALYALAVGFLYADRASLQEIAPNLAEAATIVFLLGIITAFIVQAKVGEKT